MLEAKAGPADAGVGARMFRLTGENRETGVVVSGAVMVESRTPTARLGDMLAIAVRQTDSAVRGPGPVGGLYSAGSIEGCACSRASLARCTSVAIHLPSSLLSSDTCMHL
jgi:hypothetical protein